MRWHVRATKKCGQPHAPLAASCNQPDEKAAERSASTGGLCYCGIKCAAWGAQHAATKHTPGRHRLGIRAGEPFLLCVRHNTRRQAAATHARPCGCCSDCRRHNCLCLVIKAGTEHSHERVARIYDAHKHPQPCLLEASHRGRSTPVMHMGHFAAVHAPTNQPASQ
jgi:hypothetical protein